MAGTTGQAAQSTMATGQAAPAVILWMTGMVRQAAGTGTMGQAVTEGTLTCRRRLRTAAGPHRSTRGTTDLAAGSTIAMTHCSHSHRHLDSKQAGVADLPLLTRTMTLRLAHGRRNWPRRWLIWRE